MSDFIEQYLADLPELVDAPTLAVKCRCSVGAIYQRSRRSRVNSNPHLLPQPLIIPGNNQLFFSRSAVIEWFRSASSVSWSKPGPKKRAPSRRGIGREALEARLAEEKGQ